MRRIALIMLCFSFCFGCTMVKTSKKWYKEYVNPRPQVDLTVLADEECAPQNFASLFVPVDTRLNAMLRELASQDSFPSDAWFDTFMERHPWLAAVVAVNKGGEALMSKERIALGTIDYAPLCEGDWKNRLPKASFIETSSGKNVYLAMPFFKNNEQKGCLIASFSPKDLVAYSPSASSLVLLGRDKEVLWPGKYAEKIDVLADRAWGEILAEQVSGEIDAYGTTFFWLGRAFAGTWLIYTSEIPGS